MQTFLRKYGVQTTIHFVLYEVDGVDLRVDAADAGADCSIMKDEGAEATCDNDFADEGKGYSLVLTTTEMEFAEGMIYIVDSATKLWLDEALKIETYGNASAMHAMDLDTTVPTVAENADGAWDESLTGASHNLANSAGKRLRQVSAADIIYEGGIASATASTLIFDVGPDVNNDFYDHTMVVITEGTGIGQARTIDGWVGGTLTATIHPNWVTNPAADSVAVIYAFSETHVHQLEAAVLSDIQTEMEENGASILDAISALLPGSTIAAATDIPAMVGTNFAALASVCTEARLAELAATNLPADVDTLLTRITAAVALASVCTEGRLAELAAANLPADVDAIKAKTDNQPAGVPKNVALSNFMFLMMDSSDHITPKTGLTITEEISKDGGAFAPMTNTFTEVSGGMYKIDITQAERNVDIATLKFTAAGADDRFITIISSK